MRTQQELMDLVSDLGNGFGLLMILAGRIAVPTPREATLNAFEAFEAAYGPASELQAIGQLETGGGTLTPETGERVTRLGALLRLPSRPRGEAPEAAPPSRQLSRRMRPMILWTPSAREMIRSA
jgi:hypothetical protein